MISIRNLSIKFDGNEVLKNINIDFESNKIHGVVGLNGAGKTTFFNILAKTIKPDSGVIKNNNFGLTIRDTAYLETVNFFYSGITANEYLKIFKQTNPEFKLAILQEYFKLPLDELIENYSTGMKKKLALLSVMKQDKAVFILDEPFNGLDLETNEVLQLIITRLRQKDKTVFISSHILEQLLSTCDEIHLLEDGQFVKSFSKNDFDKIDDELFGKLRIEAQKIISTAL